MSYDPATDQSAKLVGMDVPRGCGCSSSLFIAFIVVIVIAAIVSSIAKPVRTGHQSQPPSSYSHP